MWRYNRIYGCRATYSRCYLAQTAQCTGIPEDLREIVYQHTTAPIFCINSNISKYGSIILAGEIEITIPLDVMEIPIGYFRGGEIRRVAHIRRIILGAG